MGNWYAIQETTESDWGTGSYDWDEAVKMADEYSYTIIAEIDDDICVAEYHKGEDF